MFWTVFSYQPIVTDLSLLAPSLFEFSIGVHYQTNSWVQLSPFEKSSNFLFPYSRVMKNIMWMQTQSHLHVTFRQSCQIWVHESAKFPLSTLSTSHLFKQLPAIYMESMAKNNDNDSNISESNVKARGKTLLVWQFATPP